MQKSNNSRSDPKPSKIKSLYFTPYFELGPNNAIITIVNIALFGRSKINLSGFKILTVALKSILFIAGCDDTVPLF